MKTDDPNHSAELKKALASLAVEGWRLGQAFERLLGKCDTREAARHEKQLKWFLRKSAEALAEAELRLVDLTGRQFETGLPVNALNLEDFGPEEKLLIDSMLEPVLMSPDGLYRPGTVLLKSGQGPPPTPPGGPSERK